MRAASICGSCRCSSAVSPSPRALARTGRARPWAGSGSSSRRGTGRSPPFAASLPPTTAPAGWWSGAACGVAAGTRGARRGPADPRRGTGHARVRALQVGDQPPRPQLLHRLDQARRSFGDHQHWCPQPTPDQTPAHLQPVVEALPLTEHDVELHASARLVIAPCHQHALVGAARPGRQVDRVTEQHQQLDLAQSARPGRPGSTLSAPV